MSLIDNGTRTATVRAIRSVEAIPIHRDTLESAFDHSPKVIRYLLETLIATLRRVYGLPSWERNEGSAGFRSVESASGILQRRVFSEGHVFFRE
ncbi:MAG TPA: hypothetical protein PK765_04805 [bacterium]|nr:hypothetical protein [bacterium]